MFTYLRKKYNQRGFTLIELLVVIFILGIIASISVSQYSSFVSNNRLRSSQSEIINILGHCRSMAVIQGRKYHFSRLSGQRFGVLDFENDEEIVMTVELSDGIIGDINTLTYKGEPRVMFTEYASVNNGNIQLINKNGNIREIVYSSNGIRSR